MNIAIDLDFEHEKSELVKGHLRDHYGHDHVASIGTFGISKARGIFKDVARAYGLDFAKSNLISKMFPDMCNSIADALEESEDLVKVISTDPEVSEVIEYAQRLEGTVRSVGVHAAGVIVTPVPATKLVPLFASKGEPVTMFDGESLERVGIIKFDLLGLKSLTAIGKAIDLIKHRLDIDIDIDNIPEDDFGAYDLIGSNNSLAIFQIEGSRGLMDFAAASKPANIVDLATVISLFRPGPMGLGATDDYINRRSGKEPSVFEIPEYDYIFKETLGLISFQEQFMQLAGDMCGFDDIKRDVLRKATAS